LKCHEDCTLDVGSCEFECQADEQFICMWDAQCCGGKECVEGSCS
jgi:hypothetical protein